MNAILDHDTLSPDEKAALLAVPTAVSSLLAGGGSAAPDRRPVTTVQQDPVAEPKPEPEGQEPDTPVLMTRSVIPDDWSKPEGDDTMTGVLSKHLHAERTPTFGVDRKGRTGQAVNADVYAKRTAIEVQAGLEPQLIGERRGEQDFTPVDLTAYARVHAG